MAPPESFEFATTELGSGDETPDSHRWSAPTFEPGALLASRYRIVRFLARGGMGEVYEAEDTTLRMRVALKCMAHDVAHDAQSIERLKQEVLLARKVTHPNVCRLHDLGVHAIDARTTAFLTMDLLDGETLAHHLQRVGGRLEQDVALPLVRQMADALDAAHEAGVVHRDFKSRNVMLVGEDRARAVVMDFGIATAAHTEHDDDRPVESAEGRFAGTPAYMAPEQVSGGAIGPWTDVYALGVVMFEMTTGTLPFQGETVIEAVTMRLTTAPRAPRELVPDLDRAWNDVILRCLAREPRDRFARATDAARALERAGERASRAARRRAKIAAGVAAGLVAIGVAVANVGPWSKRAARGATAGGEEARRTIAVVPLKNLAGRADDAWLSTALAEMLSTELAAGEQLRVAPGDRVARARADLAVPDETSLPAPLLARLRDQLDADLVVTGAFALAGADAIRVDVTLSDARDGATTARAAATGSRAQLFDVVARIGASLRDKIGVHAPTSAQAGEARAAMSSDPEAAKAYADGVAKLRAYDAEGARAALERAVTINPSFALAHGALSTAWNVIGFDAKALDEAKKAFDTSTSLPRAEQLVLEARYRIASRDWARAADVTRALFETPPRSVDRGAMHVSALLGAGRAADALAVIAQMRALPPPDGADPRIDCLEADVQAKLSHLPERLAAGRRCEERARAIGAAQMEADALVNVGEGLAGSGDPEKGLAALDRARALYEEHGDRAGLANVLLRLSTVHRAMGNPALTVPLLERAGAITRELGSQYRRAGVANSLGITRYLLGDDPAARSAWEDARGLYDVVGDREGVAHAIGNIAVTYEDEGELVRARQAYLESRERLRALEMHQGEFEETWNVAEASLQAGDVPAAKKYAAEAEAMLGSLRDEPDYAGGTKQIVGMIAREAGDGEAARAALEEAIAIFERAKMATSAAETRVALARVRIDAGQLADAESTARDGAAALRAQKVPGSLGEALAALAKALVAQGKLAAAREALAEAEALPRTKAYVRLLVDLARGEERSASGDLDGARRALDDVRARAEAKGFVPYALAARIALARIAPGASRATALAQVAREAKDRGLLRLARDAR